MTDNNTSPAEHIMTIVIDAAGVKNMDKYTDKVLDAACTCRKHWWELWKKRDICAMAIATVRPVADATVDGILDMVDMLEGMAEDVDELASEHAGKYEARILLRTSAAAARGAADQLDMAINAGKKSR